MRRAAALVLALALAAPGEDVVDSLLAKGGMKRADLGARGSLRAPAFELPHVEGLHRDPLALPASGERLRADVSRLGPEDAAGLVRVTAERRGVHVAVPVPPEGADLARAIARLRAPLDGGPAAKGAADGVDAAGLPEPLRPAVARLLSALGDADALVRRAWAGVPRDVAASAVREPRLVPELADGARRFPDVERSARGVNAEILVEAGVLAASAVERAARELRGLAAPASLRWEIETPRGKVRVSGSGNDRHDAKDGPFLALVDLGGNDSYAGSLAAGLWPGQPVSVVIDLAGDDAYAAGDAAQGCGLGGVGVLLDAAGNDTYRALSRAQGFAQLGVGALVDGGGDDAYSVGEAGQGSAVFGSALLLDRGGRDSYLLFHDGQGFGGPGGAGLLADLTGNDTYEAVRDPARAGRADPKSDGRSATSNAQGVGLGRFGEVATTQAWGGGIGALVDLEGNDRYAGGTWCQGAGYWFGTGLLVDACGDDAYEAVWYAQGAAAHHGLGLLLELAGADAYALVGTGGAGMGFGWDFATGELVDLGGDDRHRAVRLALGAAMQRSFGLFVDARGDDVYEVEHPEEALGYVDDDPRYAARDPKAPGWFEASQAGLFLDLGGRDAYPESRGENGAAWRTRDAGKRNLGSGRDGEEALPRELRDLRDPGASLSSRPCRAS